MLSGTDFSLSVGLDLTITNAANLLPRERESCLVFEAFDVFVEELGPM